MVPCKDAASRAKRVTRYGRCAQSWRHCSLQCFACVGRGSDIVVDVIINAVYHRLEKHICLLESLLAGPKEWLAEVLQQLALNQQSGQKLLGIHGMGGIGKTTLATAVFDAALHEISRRRTFLHVGAECTSYEAISAKRCKLLQNLTASNVLPSFSSPQQERQALRGILENGGPLLLVLDDLWTAEQLCTLLGCEDSSSKRPAGVVAAMPPGSRVLLTSRSEAVVTVPGHNCWPAALFDRNHAFQLLCQKAFGDSAPPDDFTAAQQTQALTICGGLPLALCVMGRNLKDVGPNRWQVHIHALHHSICE